MTQTINRTPEINITVHRGAMKPATLARKQNGAYVAWDATVTCKVTPDDADITPITLLVGAGITLSAKDGLTNGWLTLKLTEAQSRLLVPGNFTGFEIQEGTSPNETIVVMGRMIALGGNNSGN